MGLNMKEKKFDLFGTVYTIKEQDVVKDNDNKSTIHRSFIRAG